ncbi:hypothetical protein V6N13_094585 [Hibiscus sabdariffa]
MSVGISDATSAEILVVEETLSQFKFSQWRGKFKLVIESDSKLVVNWLQNPSRAPAIFKPLIYACMMIGEDFSWSISAVPRICNTLAENLAKQGIYRVKDYVEFV